MRQATVAIFLADGFEEVEAVTPIDFLRRAGIDVLLTGIGTMSPIGARGLCILADTEIQKLPNTLDALILPGGMPGASNLAASDALKELCISINQSKGLLAAICAAPALVLGEFGILSQRRFTCFPGFEKHVKEGYFSAERVVEDGNIITSRGPGTAAEFALRIIQKLMGKEVAQEVKNSTLTAISS